MGAKIGDRKGPYRIKSLGSQPRSVDRIATIIMEKFSTTAIQLLLRTESSALKFCAIRAQGAGGQHVNKVSTAIHLRFNIQQSALPEEVKQQLLVTSDPAKTTSGIICIKVQATRSQLQNKNLAIQQLIAVLERMLFRPELRKLSKVPRSARRQRRADKRKQAERKRLRQTPGCN